MPLPNAPFSQFACCLGFESEQIGSLIKCISTLTAKLHSMFNYFTQQDGFNMQRCQTNKRKGKDNVSTAIQKAISTMEYMPIWFKDRMF